MIKTPILEPVVAYSLWAADYPPWAHNPLMQAEERAMLALMPEDLHNRIVCDAGCGSGRYLSHARRRGATVLIGLDKSEAMLNRAKAVTQEVRPDDTARIGLACADLKSLPLTSGQADVTLCGLTLGHLPGLDAPLAELRRVTHPLGRILCSELHPGGQEQGWERTFKVKGERFAVRHHWHTLAEWHAAFRRANLSVVRMLEPFLDVADIPAGARFDPAALTVPVAVVFELQRAESG